MTIIDEHPYSDTCECAQCEAIRQGDPQAYVRARNKVLAFPKMDFPSDDSTVTIYTTQWERIRHHFSEHEKKQLREAVVGEMICPSAKLVEWALLPIITREKLKRIVKEVS